jgi:hypothetical protein
MSKKRKPAKDREKTPERLPPVAIPLPFDKAVEGLLAVKPEPKKPSKPKK